MARELPSQYQPHDVEPRVAQKWTDAKAFHADPASGGEPYCIVIPPPNVTAALHMGHGLNNTLQDILIRHHRMRGRNTLWMPGTDHAGIATQTVVEKRVLAEEGKRRVDFDRDTFVAKIQAWKDEYEKRITDQLKAMGCSCDWDRQRFTMDDLCARAVREAFFRLFQDGLIYRGKRLVNWDPATQTALADDEVEMEEIDGHFYYLRYPLSDRSGHVTVATTRPETMLGDTAVAIHPKDPRAAALRGKFVRLPIVGRIIPIIEDEYVVLPDPTGGGEEKARFSSGFLKVTPAHDPNDYDLGLKHGLAQINVMAPDGSISDQHGWTDVGDAEWVLGLDRYEARKAIVEWFRQNDLLEDVKPYRHSVGHSYRSHVPIEPYLSDQWYVKVTDDQLAGAALRALPSPLAPGSAGGSSAVDAGSPPAEPGAKGWEGQLRFTPSRYAQTFRAWHENIRDWCISRQLWWGHRIPVWHFQPDLPNTEQQFPDYSDGKEGTRAYEQHLEEQLNVFSRSQNMGDAFAVRLEWTGSGCVGYICCREESLYPVMQRAERYITQVAETRKPGTARDINEVRLENWDSVEEYNLRIHVLSKMIARATLRQDPDVLDTWFSSALWPISTMGWPEETPELVTWNPSNCLSTAREIITLWVSRMVMFNLYFRGCLPFTDVFIHAMIQDGEGRKMSKSLGNGVDPLDIIHSHGADAMRFALTKMTTQTQDVRLPVRRDEKTGRNTSEKFDEGRNFANKLWNATRFALSMCHTPGPPPGSPPGSPSGESIASAALADRWILSRLHETMTLVTRGIERYEFNVYAQTMYDFVWGDFCDWYIEAAKPTLPQSPTQQRVLASVLDAILRMLHPMMPFITEELWEALNATVPQRGSPGLPGLTLPASELLIRAPWPHADDSLHDDEAQRQFDTLRELVAMVREVRAARKIAPRELLEVSIKSDHALDALLPLLTSLARVTLVAVGPRVSKPEGAAVVVRPVGELYVHITLDKAAETQRLTTRLAEVEKSIAQLTARLANKGYTDKAPAHLVQETRDQLTRAQSEAVTLREQIAGL